MRRFARTLGLPTFLHDYLLIHIRFWSASDVATPDPSVKVLVKPRFHLLLPEHVAVEIHTAYRMVGMRVKKSWLVFHFPRKACPHEQGIVKDAGFASST
jgi:hypothetical protein